ncbi:hypothetical protein [Streptomyces chromofuscus]|uniref:Uncharacterized protein n=1 Tax=Streptomyces chromofuscus TaxID=42881 RepID=A0A7M2T9C3_STRCW|nr:hypothetical protein [Streptomyces chromofuscus]QOV45152.1 hypothetical protein IPT68_04040 [Streptomyces chromofuscus]GGT33353.1 hypothetical protein GCM10010254_62080 [Streptomyces chromofuscus]
MNTSDEAERGLTDIEGFLYWEAHRRTAHRRAADFAGRVAGLSDTQRAEIEGWYVEEQLRVSRSMTQHLTDHLTAVEEHHAKRYAQLRRGAYAATTLITVLILGLCVVVLIGTAG